MALPANALSVVEKRYIRKDANGNPIETVEGMFHRVAYHIAQGHTNPGPEHDELTAVYEDMMSKLEFEPNSPAFTGAGTPLGQLAACFVLPIADDIGKDSKDGIFETLSKAARVQQSGGGVGFSFSRLRPKGDRVQKSAGIASGAVSFLKVYDVALSSIDSRFAGGSPLNYQVGENYIGCAPLDFNVASGPMVYMGIYNTAIDQLAQGGCLVPDTLVFTTKGLLSLAELVPVYKIGWHEHALEVATDEGVRRSPRSYNNGVATVLKIKTKQGVEICGTPNHRIKVWHDAEEPEWRHLCEIKPGDEALVFLNQYPDIKENHTMISSTAVLDLFPTKLYPEFAFWLGYMLCTAHTISGNDLQFTVPLGEPMIKYLPIITDKLFPTMKLTTPALQDDYYASKNEGRPFTLVSRSLIRYLMDNDLFDVSYKHLGHVPKLIRTSPRDVVAAYIMGMFEADGVLVRDNGHLVLTTPSKEVRHEVQTLLIGLGLPTISRTVQNTNFIEITETTAWHATLGFYVLPDSRFTFAATGFTERTGAWAVEVESVEEAGQSLTLDLEVDENSTYLANGLVSHNTRRGASMGVLRVDHPDIYEFVSCKAGSETKLTGFNISVGITDHFMYCLENKQPFELINPRTALTTKSVDAAHLMDHIVTNSHSNGEPGVLFLDTINHRNPLPHLYTIEATNPCVTEDTLVQTSTGPAYVRDLIAKPFLTHEGSPCNNGFFYTGFMPTYTLTLRGGDNLRCTGEHRLMLQNGRWIHAKQLVAGDVLKHSDYPGGAFVVSCNPTGVRENVYDCSVASSYHVYISNGLYSHNCGTCLCFLTLVSCK